MNHAPTLVLALLCMALATALHSQSVTFNVAGTNPRCYSEYPNGAPYSGMVTAPAGALLIVDVRFQIQAQNSNGPWSLWGPSLLRAGSGLSMNYANTSFGATQLTLTPVHVIRMRATIRYRNTFNGPILTATAFSAPVLYNYFPSPSFSLTVNGQPAAPPPVEITHYLCTGDAILGLGSLPSLSGTGLQWRLTVFRDYPGGVVGVPSDVNACDWQNGPFPSSGVNVTSLHLIPEFWESRCFSRPHGFSNREIMTVRLEIRNDCGVHSETVRILVLNAPSGATVDFFFRGSTQADSYVAQGPNNRTPNGEQNPATGAASQTDGVLSWGGTDANPTWVGASQTSLDVSGTNFYGGVLSWTMDVFVEGPLGFVLAGTYTDNTPGNSQISIQSAVMSINGSTPSAGYFSQNFNNSPTGVLGKKFRVKLTGNGVCGQQPFKEGYFRIIPNDSPDDNRVWWLGSGGTGNGNAPALHDESILLSPNPAKTFATLEIFADAGAEALLFAIGMDGRAMPLMGDGRITLDEGSNSLALDVSHLPPGVYSIQVVRPGKVLSAKMVKL